MAVQVRRTPSSGLEPQTVPARPGQLTHDDGTAFARSSLGERTADWNGRKDVSLIAIVVGFALGLTGRARIALTGAAVTWGLTTLYLAVLARGSAGDDPSDHGITLGFWVVQVGILVVSLVIAWGTSRLRSARLQKA